MLGKLFDFLHCQSTYSLTVFFLFFFYKSRQLTVPSDRRLVSRDRSVRLAHVYMFRNRCGVRWEYYNLCVKNRAGIKWLWKTQYQSKSCGESHPEPTVRRTIQNPSQLPVISTKREKKHAYKVRLVLFYFSSVEKLVRDFLANHQV